MKKSSYQKRLAEIKELNEENNKLKESLFAKGNVFFMQKSLDFYSNRSV